MCSTGPPIIVLNEEKDQPSSLLIPCFLCIITTSSTKCSSPVCGYLERTFHFLLSFWPIFSKVRRFDELMLSDRYWKFYESIALVIIVIAKIWRSLCRFHNKYISVNLVICWSRELILSLMVKIFPNVTDLIFLRPNLESFYDLTTRV